MVDPKDPPVGSYEWYVENYTNPNGNELEENDSSIQWEGKMSEEMQELYDEAHAEEEAEE